MSSASRFIETSFGAPMLNGSPGLWGWSSSEMTADTVSSTWLKQRRCSPVP
jgi:hypothetical protein